MRAIIIDRAISSRVAHPDQRDEIRSGATVPPLAWAFLYLPVRVPEPVKLPLFRAVELGKPGFPDGFVAVLFPVLPWPNVSPVPVVKSSDVCPRTSPHGYRRDPVQQQPSNGDPAEGN
jgi:hypothetical protein